MDSKQIEIEGMKELLKEDELEIGRLRKEIKKLKEERDDFMLKYSKALEEKIVQTNNLCTERNKLEEENKKLKSDLSLVIKERDDNIKQNKKLNVIIENNNSEQKADWEHIEELEEENKTLKNENVRLVKNLAEYKNEITDLKEENKKLKAELEFYKKQYEHSMGEN